MLVQPVHLDRKIEPDFTVDLFVFLDIRFLGPKYRVVIELVIDKEKNCLMISYTLFRVSCIQCSVPSILWPTVQRLLRGIALEDSEWPILS
ncbi:hypothetical protein AFLA_005879 [Aspergillus flavus NRRL3357]|nr:hypothetical protein AFLA_005879 [Aspergillus flavus NRRL3357]